MTREDHDKSYRVGDRHSREGNGHSREDEHREGRHHHSSSSYPKNRRLIHRSHNHHQSHSDRNKHNHSNGTNSVHRDEYRSERSERYKTSWRKLADDQSSDDEWEAAVPLESIRMLCENGLISRNQETSILFAIKW